MIASTMILTGSILILGLAGYWMRRALKAERRVKDLESLLAEWRKSHAVHVHLAVEAFSRLDRIISLETKSMAHVGKVAVAIARGER